jgi:hypothetical protein
MNPEPARPYAAAKPNPFAAQGAFLPGPPHGSQGIGVQSTSVMAIISLISGIAAWFMIPVIGAIVAIITGHVAKREIRDSGGRTDGETYATIGLWLGYAQMALGLLILAIVILVIVAAIPMAR